MNATIGDNSLGPLKARADDLLITAAKWAELDVHTAERADKLSAFALRRPTDTTSADVVLAMHEWLKSQLDLLGVKTTATAECDLVAPGKKHT